MQPAALDKLLKPLFQAELTAFGAAGLGAVGDALGVALLVKIFFEVEEGVFKIEGVIDVWWWLVGVG